MKKTVNDEFVQALIGNKANQSIESLKLFAQFIGSWEWTGFDYNKDGTKTPTKGKWIFELVLNGNAIQDVFIFENPHKDTLSFAEYGTTLRFPYADGKIWKVIWFGPMNKTIRIFEAKLIGNEIVLEGKNEQNELINWRFSGIADNGFHWRGERSSDEGKSWFLYEELNAKKR